MGREVVEMDTAEMQGGGVRYRLNEPAVAADIFDGEAVIMHLENGTYYGLDRVGGAIWTLIIGARTIDEIADAVAEHYQVDREAIVADVGSLVAQMAEEDLIIEANGKAAEATEIGFPGETYATPTLSIYRDMKNLLAFDPPLPDFKAKDFQ